MRAFFRCLKTWKLHQIYLRFLFSFTSCLSGATSDQARSREHLPRTIVIVAAEHCRRLTSLSPTHLHQSSEAGTESFNASIASNSVSCGLEIVFRAYDLSQSPNCHWAYLLKLFTYKLNVYNADTWHSTSTSQPLF